MAIKVYNPTSPGRRGMSGIDYSCLSKVEPEKSLIVPLKKHSGRNNQGRITVRHKGGGAKRKYRIIDFKRDKDNIPAKVASIEYDPNRTAFIALLHYKDGEKRYIIAPEGLKVGDTVISGENVEPEIGNAMPLKNIPLGMEIHNVELYPGRGGQLARAAGCSVRLSAKEGKYAHLLLPSGGIRMVPLECKATIGRVSNIDHANVVIGKAGRSRWMRKRPSVRGTAMNPVAHPMGGGEGRTKGGRHPCSPTGKLAKGGNTRKKRNITDPFIIRLRRGK